MWSHWPHWPLTVAGRCGWNRIQRHLLSSQSVIHLRHVKRFMFRSIVCRRSMLGTKHGQARNSRGVVAGAKKQSMEWLTRREGETARISLSVEEIALKRAFFVWHGESLVWLVIWCTPHVPVCPSSGDNYSYSCADSSLHNNDKNNCS